MVLLLSPTYGARCRLLESVSTTHLILYIEILDLHLQKLICTVFSQENVLDFPTWSKKKEKKKKGIDPERRGIQRDANSVFQEQISWWTLQHDLWRYNGWGLFVFLTLPCGFLNTLWCRTVLQHRFCPACFISDGSSLKLLQIFFYVSLKDALLV